MDKNGSVDESLYQAIEFLKSSDDIEEVTTISAGELNIIKEESTSPLQFERTLYESATIIDGKVNFMTRNTNDHQLEENYTVISNEESLYYVPYAVYEDKLFSRIKSI